MHIDFCCAALSLMFHPLSCPPQTELWESLSSSSKKIFILEDRLKKIIYFDRYYHTSTNIESPHLYDLMHIFFKVLAFL